jgi:hypothetical protein
MTRTLTSLFAAVAVFTAMAAKSPDATKKSLPRFETVQQIVVQYFATLPEYKPGTIISRKQVEPLLDTLAKEGWVVADRDEILKLVPRDDEFLVTQLRTPNGRKMMDQLVSNPAGYDRLDRLSQIPMGKQTVRDLIAGPDGYKLLDYMTQTKGGDELGRMLSKDPHGHDFNQATGRIYTDGALLARLRASYEAAARQARNTTSN